MVLLMLCVVESLDDRKTWVKDISRFDVFQVAGNYLQKEQILSGVCCQLCNCIIMKSSCWFEVHVGVIFHFNKFRCGQAKFVEMCKLNRKAAEEGNWICLLLHIYVVIRALILNYTVFTLARLYNMWLKCMCIYCACKTWCSCRENWVIM